MSERNTVWLAPPFRRGQPKEVEAKPELLVPLMVAGYSQCDPPATDEEVTEHVG